MPERDERARAWNWLLRRVASPPVKSPPPQTKAKVSAKNTPSRLPGDNILAG